jgi:hypothetical protein
MHENPRVRTQMRHKTADTLVFFFFASYWTSSSAHRRKSVSTAGLISCCGWSQSSCESSSCDVVAGALTSCENPQCIQRQAVTSGSVWAAVSRRFRQPRGFRKRLFLGFGSRPCHLPCRVCGHQGRRVSVIVWTHEANNWCFLGPNSTTAVLIL